MPSSEKVDMKVIVAPASAIRCSSACSAGLRSSARRTSCLSYCAQLRLVA